MSEFAQADGAGWIESSLRKSWEEVNSLLPRIAFKMATGSGKTVVMAMLIAWQVLNKIANPRDARYSDAFLVVTPGITIRDRLRVLLPNDPQNFYRARDILPVEKVTELGKAKIIITNFHTFLLHERGDASKIAKDILSRGKGNALTETPDQMVRRGEDLSQRCASLPSAFLSITETTIVILSDSKRQAFPNDSYSAAAKRRQSEYGCSRLDMLRSHRGGLRYGILDKRRAMFALPVASPA